jgi:hypothetical protein
VRRLRFVCVTLAAKIRKRSVFRIIVANRTEGFKARELRSELPEKHPKFYVRGRFRSDLIANESPMRLKVRARVDRPYDHLPRSG